MKKVLSYFPVIKCSGNLKLCGWPSAKEHVSGFSHGNTRVEYIREPNAEPNPSAEIRMISERVFYIAWGKIGGSGPARIILWGSVSCGVQNFDLET